MDFCDAKLLIFSYMLKFIEDFFRFSLPNGVTLHKIDSFSLSIA